MVEQVEEHLISYGYLMMAFALGGGIAIVSSWIASLYMRKAYTNEPIFSIPDEALTIDDDLASIEDAIDIETQEQRERREELEFELLRSNL